MQRLFKISIPSGSHFSTAIDISSLQPMSIQIPAVWTDAQLSIQVSHDGETWFDVYADGEEQLVPAGASRHCDLNLNVGGMQYLRFRSGTSASSVNQTGARVISGVGIVVS